MPSTDIVRDLATGNDRDVVLAGGDLSLVSGTASIVQDANTALQVFLGEWFLDQGVGLPYFQTILVKDPSLDLVRAAYRACLFDVPGIVEVLALDLVFDTKARLLNVSWTAQSDVGVINGAVSVGGLTWPDRTA